MLFDQRELAGIQSGAITVVFRTWRSPRVKVGTRLRTPIGLVEVVDLVATGPEQVDVAQANAAGFSDLEAFRQWLDDRPGVLHRIDVRPAGPDPLVELRNRNDFGGDELEKLIRRLDRMDARAQEPWTRPVLRLIADRPGVVSTELARQIGWERHYLKQRVRQLKSLGLTESLEVGYRISPRGAAFLGLDQPKGNDA